MCGYTVNTHYIRQLIEREWSDRRSPHTAALISLSSGLVRTAFAYHAMLLSHDLS